MASKKKKKDPKPKQRDSQKVDERLKQVQSIEPPEQNEFKMDNDDSIDRFLRFGLKRRVKKFGDMTIRDQKKFTRRTHRKTAPMPWLKNKKRS